MTNPVLVEVMRGDVVESRHRGALCVVDTDGGTMLEIGDVDHAVFPRSAVKAIQALPLIESGAADAFRLSDAEIALACASHSGEPAHTELARGMLTKAGLADDALECGAHWPTKQEAMIALAGRGETPSALHNNCSGKHAGFLCTCVHAGIDRHGYVERGHTLQAMVREAMQSVTGAPHGEATCGRDGCSIPTYAVPLKSLAAGFARMATGQGLGSQRARAARRILAACMANPFFVAGTGRLDTRIMEAGRGRIFVKTGAEGVYCGALPELGLGIAVKCDDGAGRASETVIVAVLASLLAADEALAATLRALAEPALTNWRGFEVGRLLLARPLTPDGQAT